MTKKEMIFEAFESFGLHPAYDEDGDVQVRYQMKSFYAHADDDDEDNFCMLVFPGACSVEEDQVQLMLMVCNRVSRELPCVTTFLEENLEYMTAIYSFYFTDQASLRYQLEKGLERLGIVRPLILKHVKELRDED